VKLPCRSFLAGLSIAANLIFPLGASTPAQIAPDLLRTSPGAGPSEPALWISAKTAADPAKVLVSAADLKVTGVGGVPINKNTESLWLTGLAALPKPVPVLLVFFVGPDNWHNTHWVHSTSFGPPAVSDFRSTAAHLHLEVDPDHGLVRVQDKTFRLSDSNVFLVLNPNTDAGAERVEPVGNFPLVPSDEPAGIAFLKTNPAVASRLRGVIKELKSRPSETDLPNPVSPAGAYRRFKL
jgi:hypothetical protein